MQNHTLFSTYLHDLISARRVTAEHLACELDHADTRKVQSWLDGCAAPGIQELSALASVLHADAVVMTTGWMIDKEPSCEDRLWRTVLGPLGATFPKSGDLTLRMTRPHRDMDVGDPHDTGWGAAFEVQQPGKVRKRSAASRVTLAV